MPWTPRPWRPFLLSPRCGAGRSRGSERPRPLILPLAAAAPPSLHRLSAARKGRQEHRERAPGLGMAGPVAGHCGKAPKAPTADRPETGGGVIQGTAHFLHLSRAAFGTGCRRGSSPAASLLGWAYPPRRGRRCFLLAHRRIWRTASSASACGCPPHRMRERVFLQVARAVRRSAITRAPQLRHHILRGPFDDSAGCGAGRSRVRR